MEIYANCLKTNRAFVYFSKIQHVSWDIEPDNMFNVKIHTNAPRHVNQRMSKEDFTKFLNAYMSYEGVSFL